MKKSRAKKGRILSASAISDFRPTTDRVIREDGKTLVRDTRGEFADVEVTSDEFTPGNRANLEALPRGKFDIMEYVIERTPFLSAEGRRERLEAIAEIRRSRGW